MLVVRDVQLQVLSAPARLQFEAEMLAYLRRCYPTDDELLGESGLRSVIRDGQREALSHKFTQPADVRSFITVRLVLGSHFARDPLLPWAARILHEGQGRPGTMDRLVSEATEYLELTSGEEGQYALRAMVRATSLSFGELTADRSGEDVDAATLALLRRVWPQKCRLTQPEQWSEFLHLAAASAAADGLDTPGTTRAYTLLMFLLGAGFARDPAVPWARAALDASHGASAVTRAAALHEAGLATVARLRDVLAAAGA
jgi:hypothetical protein